MRWRRGTAELPQQMVRRVLLCPSMLAVSERARTKELTAHVACGQRCVHAARPAFTGSTPSWQPFRHASAACPCSKLERAPLTHEVHLLGWAPYDPSPVQKDALGVEQAAAGRALCVRSGILIRGRQGAEAR